MKAARATSSPGPVRAAALRLVSPLPPGRALDAPCGTGEVALALGRAGWDVVGLDRDPSTALASGVRAQAGDLERALPFADRSFDLVVSVEGIEHVEGQAAFLREAARVLAPGGSLVLTTPNVLGRPSRTSLRRKAYARFFRPTPPGGATPFEHEHRHPIDAVRLDFLLREAGLVPEAYDCERGPDGAPTIRRRVARFLEARGIRRHNPRADLLLEPAVFHGRVLALRAKRPGPPQEGREGRRAARGLSDGLGLAAAAARDAATESGSTTSSR
jgi:SAM-dependent methyltransferase